MWCLRSNQRQVLQALRRCCDEPGLGRSRADRCVCILTGSNESQAKPSPCFALILCSYEPCSDGKLHSHTLTFIPSPIPGRAILCPLHFSLRLASVYQRRSGRCSIKQALTASAPRGEDSAAGAPQARAAAGAAPGAAAGGSAAPRPSGAHTGAAMAAGGRSTPQPRVSEAEEGAQLPAPPNEPFPTRPGLTGAAAGAPGQDSAPGCRPPAPSWA